MPKQKSKDNGKTAPKKDAAPKEKEAPIVSPYGKADLAAFKKLLLARKRILQGDVTMLQDEALKKGQDSGDLSSLPLHIADQGTDSFEQDMTLGLMENESDELQEIEEALERIKDNRYGVCETCNKSIPKTRLQAIPFARLCITCKRKEDGD